VLTQFPPDLKCAWEFRHASWFDAETYEVLRTGNAALCVADTDEATTPLEPTADFGYVRLRDEGYTKKSMEDWVAKVREMGKGWTDAYVFFKHEGKGRGRSLPRSSRGYGLAGDYRPAHLGRGACYGVLRFDITGHSTSGGFGTHAGWGSTESV